MECSTESNQIGMKVKTSFQVKKFSAMKKLGDGTVVVMDMFTILIVEMVSWVYVYVRAYQDAHFKYMQFV